MWTLDTVPLHEANIITKAIKAMVRIVKGLHSFACTHAFIHELNKPYLLLPFLKKLVLIYRPLRDERLS